MAKKSIKSSPSQPEEENSPERDNAGSNGNSPSTSSTLRSPTASIQPSPEAKNETLQELDGNDSDSNMSGLTDFSNEENEEIILDRKELRQCQDDFKDLETEYSQVKQLFYQVKVLGIEAESDMINRGKCPDYIEESQFAYAKSRRAMRKAGIERVFKIWHLDKNIHVSFASANAQYECSAMELSTRRSKKLYCMKTKYERALTKIQSIQEARRKILMNNQHKVSKPPVTTSLPPLSSLNHNIPHPRLVYPESVHVPLTIPLPKPNRQAEPLTKPSGTYLDHSIDVGPDVYASKGTLSYFGRVIVPGTIVTVTDPERKTYTASFIENKFEYIVIELASGDRVNIPLRDLALRHCKLEL